MLDMDCLVNYFIFLRSYFILPFIVNVLNEAFNLWFFLFLSSLHLSMFHTTSIIIVDVYCSYDNCY